MLCRALCLNHSPKYKIVKSPNCTHIVGEVLITGGRIGKVEVLGPCEVIIRLGRTLIVVITNSANDGFLQVQ